MPQLISAEEHSRQCVLAAYSSRLNPYALHPGEQRLLAPKLPSASLPVYLNIRNGVLRLWTRNPLVDVSREEALECARTRHAALALFAHEWLSRNGYINFGCVEISTLALGQNLHLPASKRKTILIIGAGVSGLACARQLQGLFKQFHERWTKQRREPIPTVVLLEGRARIGGRVYSHPLSRQVQQSLPNGLANTAELGAQIITGFENGNPLDAIVRGQLALHHHTMKDNMILHDYDGSRIDENRDIRMQKLFNDFLETASAHSWKPHPKAIMEGNRSVMVLNSNTLPQSGSAGYSNGQIEVKDEKILIDAETVPTLGAHLDGLVSQYQNKVGLSAQELRLINWHYANMEYANAVNVNQLSLGGWDQDQGNEFDGRHAEVIGGYSQVPRGLLKYPSKLDVRLKKVVRHIRYKGNTGSAAPRSTVVCEDGETFTADHIVSTLPLGVLQEGRVAFDPPLPTWKTGALERMGFGVLNKVVMVFDRVFWEKDRDMFGLLNQPDTPGSLSQKDYASQRGRFYLFWNRVKTSGRPMLVGLMAGDAALEAEKTSDEELVKEATTRLASMFSLPSRPIPEEAVVTRWNKDPFARGSYSYLGPKSRQGDYEAMAQSVANLHFAGEATCGTHPATVHGAYLSGLRAAADVVEALIGPVPVSYEAEESKQNGSA